MKISQAGILMLAVFMAVAGSGCNYYNQVMARKNVVDGADAFRGRKFPVAEEHFRKAVQIAPDGSKEKQTAELFLARTLHSEFAANRTQTNKAEEAIDVYKKVLQADPSDNSSFKAVANLYESLQRQDDWRTWVTERSSNENVPPEQRAEAYTSLAAKENACANNISDVEPVKKTVIKDGKAAFTFTKPADPAEFDKLKGCTQKGTELIDKALALDKNSESIWSYKTSLLVQQMRIAEMENRMADKDKIKVDADAAKAEFTRLAEISRQKREAEEAKKKAEEEAKTGVKSEGAAANTNAQ